MATVKVVNHFGDVADALPDILSKVVRKTALDVQRMAAQAAPVDTGFLKSSIYTVTDEGSTYANASQRAHGKNEFEGMLPEIGEQADKTTAYVAVGASYGLYVEYGSRHGPAQPYFEPAMEAGRGPFEAALGKVEDAMRKFEV